jgi:hypothetical protein
VSGAVQRLGCSLGYSRGAAALIPDRLLFRPDISPVGANRASVMRCWRSLLAAVGCCCCCHRCCQPLVLFPSWKVSLVPRLARVFASELVRASSKWYVGAARVAAPLVEAGERDASLTDCGGREDRLCVDPEISELEVTWYAIGRKIHSESSYTLST